MTGGELCRIISNSFRRSNVEKKKKKRWKTKRKEKFARQETVPIFFLPPLDTKFFQTIITINTIIATAPSLSS